MKEQDIIHFALNNLAGTHQLLGTWEPVDNNQVVGAIDFHFQNGNEHVFIEVKKELRNYHMPKITELAKHYRPLMVVADNIFPTLKEELRNLNIGYLDAAANIYLRTPNTFVWLDGKKHTRTKEKTTNRAFTKTGLKLIFNLLTRDILNEPYRVMADAAEIAVGSIKQIIDGLTTAGYIIKLDNKRLALNNKKALLDRWVNGYEETLKPDLLIGTFRFANEVTRNEWKRLPTDEQTVWGGEAAADIMTDYLRPYQFTAYTHDTKIGVMQKWRLIPAEEGDIKVYKKFWRHLTDFAYDKNIIHGPESMPAIAPALLTYADLMLTLDPRCVEVAANIYDNFLRYDFELKQ